MRITAYPTLLCLLIAFTASKCTQPDQPSLKINKGDHIVLIGNNLCSRMMNFGHFETEMHLRYPDSLLLIRNMCDGGNTPGFRPHSGRVSPWAFPGAERFQSELAQNSGSQGHFETPDEWLTRLGADVIIACFGFNESFQGEAGLDNFKAELGAFIEHTLNQNTMASQHHNWHLSPPLLSKTYPANLIIQTGKKKMPTLHFIPMLCRKWQIA